MKNLLKKYSHIWPILVYLPIYLVWFFSLENRTGVSIRIIESPLDSLIPFNEWFVIPYFMWFPFIAVSVSYFFFKDKWEYYRLCGILILGMTITLVIYTFDPNGVALRPDLSALSRENPALSVLRLLHKADTSTNVCPSLHVYNSLAICLAVMTSKHLKKKIWIKAFVLILTFFICLSTVFLKQHSVVDVFYAFLLAGVLAPFFYCRPFQRLFHKKG